MSQEGCQCPCIPKCCPQGYILKKNNTGGLHHGYDCQKSTNNVLSLPKVQIKDDPREQPVNQTFFAGVFPSCEGLGSKWEYTHYLNFELEPIFDDYILHLGENGETVTTQFGISVRNRNNANKNNMMFLFTLQLHLTMREHRMFLYDITLGKIFFLHHTVQFELNLLFFFIP